MYANDVVGNLSVSQAILLRHPPTHPLLFVMLSTREVLELQPEAIHSVSFDLVSTCVVHNTA